MTSEQHAKLMVFIKESTTIDEALRKFEAKGGPALTARRLREYHSRAGLPNPATFLKVTQKSLNKSDESVDRLKIKELEQKVKFLVEENKALHADWFSGEKVKAFIHEVKLYKPAKPKWLNLKKEGANTGTPVLVGSDWHYGETVAAIQMNGTNAFNKDIAQRRIETFFSKPIDLLIHHMAKPKYDMMVLPIIGDMISGNIHEELAETNWAPIGPCVVDLAGQLIAGIERLAGALKKLYVPMLPGNHGRIRQQKRFKNNAYDSFEWIMYHMIAKYFKDRDDIVFDIGESKYLPFSIYGTRFLAHHGDDFKGGGGISGSWSPLVRGDMKRRKQAMATNRPYDYMIIGHWHFYQELPGVRCNGSLKGYDEYAQSFGFDFQVPIQDMFLVHPEYGITARWPIILEKPGTTFNLRTNEAIDQKEASK